MYGRTLLALIGGALVAAALVAGCGGGDDGDTENGAQSADNASATEGEAGSADGNGSGSGEELSSKTISKKAFVKRGNAVCEATVGRVTAKAAPTLQEASDEDRIATEEELVESVFIPSLQTEVEQLAELGAPAGDRAQVEAILAAIQKVVDDSEADPAAAVAAKGNQYAGAARVADRYGLTECPFG